MKRKTSSAPRKVRKSTKGILSFVARHKYIVTLILFAAIILFLDNNSLWNKQQLKQQNKEIREEITKLEEACRRDSARLEELKSDSNEIVRVARELYFMKRSNEDVYIIKE